MTNNHRRLTHIVISLALAGTMLLAACGGTPAAPQPSIRPPAATTAAPATTLPAPSAAPTPAPSVPAATAAPASTTPPAPVAQVLPKPIYFVNERQQIIRLEADGVTQTALTDGSQQIVGFDVSPADGSLVYITLDQSANTQPPPATLTQTDADGTNPVELVKGQGFIVTARWSPDGKNIAYAIFDPEPTAGIYLIADGGGEPRRVQAKESSSDPGGVGSGRVFQVLSWSPDSQKLLLASNFDQMVGGDIGTIGIAVKNLADNSLVELTRPGAEPYTCFEASWSQDSNSIYCSNYDVTPGSPALWRADLAGATLTPLIASETGGQQNRVHSAQQLADGKIYSFMMSTPASTSVQPVFGMQRTAADGVSEQTALRNKGYEIVSALWAPDGSGAVVSVFDQGGSSLLWLPSDGGPEVVLAQNSSFAVWGPGTQ